MSMEKTNLKPGIERAGRPAGRLSRFLLASLVPGMIYFAFVAVVRFTPLMRWGDTVSTSPFVVFTALLSALLTILIGFLIVRRSPGNVCGPLLVLFGIGSANIGLFDTVQSGYVQAVLQFVNTSIYLWVLAALFVYFPDGAAYKPWIGQLVGWLALPLLVVTVVQLASDPSLDNLGTANPLYQKALGPLLPMTEWAFPLLLLGSIGSSIFGFFLRYRAVTGYQRQQMRWYMFCASTLLVLVLAWFVGFGTGQPDNGLYFSLLLIVSDIALPLIPTVGIGVAILRHRLYDIDVIIRRTLVYSVLTVTLALVYWGGVASLQMLLRPLSGEGNDLAIVGTTLLVAGLFFPLRARIQAFIDRRFYRRKYDAALTLASFGARARDEVDLKALTGHLVTVVEETMQPEHVSLWLRPISSPRKENAS